MSFILSFGELLWDIFPEYKKPGGSPANLAYHLHVLGNQSHLISRVGEDNHGREILNFISEKGLSTKFIQKDLTQPTGTVTVHFSGDEPSYTIHRPSAWDYIEMTDNLENVLKKTEAVCFASLSQRESKSAATLQQILEIVPENSLKVFDLNLRPPFIDQTAILKSIEKADVVKFNEDELETVSDWLDVDNLPAYLLRNDPHKKILLTLGSDGSALFTENGYTKHKAYPISGKGDFVGVGDAFLACATHLILKNEEPTELIKKANRYAAAVASQQGGMPDIEQEILSEVS